MSCSFVIVGAGRGTRLGGPSRKAWTALSGRPLWWHSARALRAAVPTAEIVLVVHAEDLPATESSPGRAWCAEVPIDRIVTGGAERQDSVLAGVRATRADARFVLVHDAARPFVAEDRVRDLLAALEAGAEAALLAARVAATVQRIDAQGHLVETLDREVLRLASTPQGASRALLLQALEAAEASGQRFTDEAGLLRAAGILVRLIEDDPMNFKVTTPSDLKLAAALFATEPLRVGHGYDIHVIAAGGPLVLGAIDIPVDFHLDGHSDGDAVIHAIIEAFLGAAGLPDIGEHFPPTDPTLKGVDSKLLLARTLADLSARGLYPLQVDVSIIAEKPRLLPYKALMKARLMELLALPADRVAVKARSSEGVGPIGRGEAIAVHCTGTLCGSMVPLP